VDRELYELAERVGLALKGRGFMLVTAESCTGGWIGQAVTMVPGSSAWFDCGFITYTNTAKYGAVSEQTVVEMSAGALARSRAQIAVAVSGIAGPDGGSAEKPVGTVCIAWAARGSSPAARTVVFPGDRDAVRRASVIAALAGVLERL
jgi:nicotinamide-nucleotide amidase